MASPSAWASRLERSISGTGRPIGRLTSPHGAMSMTPIPTCPSTCRRRISRNGRTSWRAVGGGARVGGGSSAAGRPLSTGGLVAITSRWLLLALVLDLSITRLSLRIAIFLPKGAVVADVVGAFARVGAVVENVLVLVALVALGALLAESGGRAGSAWKAGLALTAGVAIGGLLSHWQAPSPVVSAALGALTVGAALLLAVPAVRAAARDPYAVAILALAVAASLPALAALGGAAGAATDAAGAPGLGLALPTVGGVGFLIGGVLAA